MALVGRTLAFGVSRRFSSALRSRSAFSTTVGLSENYGFARQRQGYRQSCRFLSSTATVPSGTIKNMESIQTAVLDAMNELFDPAAPDTFFREVE